MVVTKSRLRSVHSSPKAENADAVLGMMTRSMPSCSIRALAWIPPAPPKERMAKSLGSCPFSTETTRMPLSMLVLMMRKMPSAASVGVMSRRRARRRIALCAASRSSLISPPR